MSGPIATRDGLLSFVDELPPEDISVAVAAAEVLRRVDGRGRVSRARWEGREETMGFAPTSGGDDPEGGAAIGTAAAGPALERLHDAGVIVLEPATDGWSEIAVRDELWSDIGDQAMTVVSDIDALVDAFRRSAGGVAAVGFAPEETGSRLWAEGLTKIYQRRTVVDDVDISVNQGEIVGLLGPNGAGKTTTFYMLVGLIPPNEGTVHLDEREITKVPMYKRAHMGIGYLAQEPSVFRKLTVEENVLAILETLDVPKKERKDLLEELLEELSIDHLRDNMAYSLSGGERRRLEITRALVQRPKFMLLDEPFAGIDPIATSDIQHIVHELKEKGIGVIISDHNVEQTLDIVDRAYIMYEGRIRVGGTVSELVWNDEVAEIYLGPTLTQRMRQRYDRPPAAVGAGEAE